MTPDPVRRPYEPDIWEKGFALGLEQGASQARVQGIFIGIFVALFGLGVYYLLGKFIVRLF